MINIEDIEKEIKKIEETGCTSWNCCEKLATLYIIRKYFKEDHPEIKTSQSSISMM